MSKTEDEYNWAVYTAEYSAQLNEIKRDDNNDFFISTFEQDGDGLSFGGNLHNNWKEIYEMAYRLKPKTILETGCGGCYHIKNLSVLLPESEISGCDLLRTQLEFGRTFSELPDRIKTWQHNMTSGPPAGQYEFVFSQAVVMHLSTENARLMLSNMKAASTKYVMMVEGVKNHANWYDLVKEVFGPDWEFSQPNKYVTNSILLTKKSA
jgi:trans-aconitate methyltransferase